MQLIRQYITSPKFSHVQYILLKSRFSNHVCDGYVPEITFVDKVGTCACAHVCMLLRLLTTKYVRIHKLKLAILTYYTNVTAFHLFIDTCC